MRILDIRNYHETIIERHKRINCLRSSLGNDTIIGIQDQQGIEEHDLNRYTLHIGVVENNYRDIYGTKKTQINYGKILDK